MRKIEKTLSLLFAGLVSVIALAIISNLLGIRLGRMALVLQVSMFVIPTLLLLLHGLTSLGIKKGMLLIGLASAVGTFFEYVGLTYGTFFGGTYIYKSQLTFFKVPIVVMIFWAVFIYSGYCLTNALTAFIRFSQPTQKLQNWWRLLPLILLDGYFVLAIDFFLDPVAVKLGEWSWPTGGQYFGIPWGNFVGWFLIAVIVSAVFRSIQYLSKNKPLQLTKLMTVFPTFGYGLLALYLATLAWQFQLGIFIFIGCLFMLPQSIFICGLYFRSIISASANNLKKHAHQHHKNPHHHPQHPVHRS